MVIFILTFCGEVCCSVREAPWLSGRSSSAIAQKVTVSHEFEAQPVGSSCILIWARLFKTKDVVSLRFVKFSEVTFSNMLFFFFF